MSNFCRPMSLSTMFPHQRNHPSYPYHHYPNWEMTPPQISGDLAKSPGTNEPWFSSGGFGYPNPVECHGYCPNSYFPVYYGFRPPHWHLPQPPYSHYPHGPCLPYPEVYSPYFVPPHYSVGQPRYEYENPIGNHCCGCQNHNCSSKVNSNVKIEEQVPEVVKAEEHNPSAPIKSGEYQKPFVWIPPGYIKGEDGNLSSRPGPHVWNGWFPFDLGNINSLKQGEVEGKKQDEKNEENRSHFSDPVIWMPAYERRQEAETKDQKGVASFPKSPEETPSKQNQQNEEKREQFPLPFFWIPTVDKGPEAEMKDLKEASHNPKSAEEVLPKLKTIPVKLIRGDDHRDEPVVADDVSQVRAKVAEEELKPKNISVKQMDDSEAEKRSGDSRKAEPKTIPVKQMEGNANKISHGSTKSQPGSPKTSSKLPPVCLRVDPLPRKKNGNGTSRSPSPPGQKDKLQKDRERTSLSSSGKECQDSKMQGTNLKKESEEHIRDGTINSAAVNKEEMGENCKKEDSVNRLRDVPVVAKEEVPVPVTVVKKAVETDKKEQETDRKEAESKKENTEDVRKNKKDISVFEAAVLIQSAYRGYAVRKWEPLKKLRLVAKVREQMEEVRERIRALESSPNLLRDEKQKMIIGETIMGLLLQLDVIQGLHPSVRDIRKSVARDLVSLQERLDSLASQKSEESDLGSDAPMNSAKEVAENLPELLGQNDDEKPLELSNVASISLHGSDLEANGPANESIESEYPLLEEEHVDSAADELLVGPSANEVVADSSEQCEEKVVVEYPVDNKEFLLKVQEGTQNVDSEQNVEHVIKPNTPSSHSDSEPVAAKEDYLVENSEITDFDPKRESSVLQPLGREDCRDNLEDSARVLEGVADDNSSQAVDILPSNSTDHIIASQAEDMEVILKESNDDVCGTELPKIDRCIVEEVGKECLPSVQLSAAESASEAPNVTEEGSGSNGLMETVMGRGIDDKPYGSETVEEVLTSSATEMEGEINGVDRESGGSEMEVVITSSSAEMGREIASSNPVAQVSHVETPNIQDDIWGGQMHLHDKDQIEDNQMTETVVIGEVACEPIGSELAEGVVTNPAEGMTGEIKEIDQTSCGSEIVDVITSPAAEMEGEWKGIDQKPYGCKTVDVMMSPAGEMGEVCASLDPVVEVSHEETPKIMDDIQGGQVPQHGRGLVEDNKKLKEQLEKMVQAGKEQLSVIADLSGRIKDLERKLKNNKRMKVRVPRVSTLSSAKRSNGLTKRNAVNCAA